MDSVATVEHRILDNLPGQPFKSRKAHQDAVRRALKRAGYTPVRATYDEAGDCHTCGECGRCPGYHIPREV